MNDVVEIAAAVGALLAAIFTAWAAKGASDAAKTAKAGVAAEHKPILVDVPYEPYTDYEHEIPWPTRSAKSAWRGEIRIDPEKGTFAIPARNVGRGLARIKTFQLSLASGATYAERSTLAIPPGEDAYLMGAPDANSDFAKALRRAPSPLHDALPLIFNATYTDAVGDQLERVELSIGSQGGTTALRVVAMEHRR